ncbi:unnamed protein product [Moneuplotes crassus]|uniref:Uncharacterized protein n=1 Tax=Euplotes crassus TaxID=5936 RepID=A0AAD1UAN8_EUPCR|nr:unnamed protein product [Moneuplotes crassus]
MRSTQLELSQVISKKADSSLFIPDHFEPDSRLLRLKPQRKRFFRYDTNDTRLKSTKNSPSATRSYFSKNTDKKQYLRTKRKINGDSRKNTGFNKNKRTLRRRVLERRIKAALNQEVAVQSGEMKVDDIKPEKSIQEKCGGEESVQSINEQCPNIQVIEKLKKKSCKKKQQLKSVAEFSINLGLNNDISLDSSPVSFINFSKNTGRQNQPVSQSRGTSPMNSSPFLLDNSMEMYNKASFGSNPRFITTKLNVITCDSLPKIPVKKTIRPPKVQIRTNRLRKLYRLIEEKTNRAMKRRLNHGRGATIWDSQVCGSRITKSRLKEL